MLIDLTGAALIFTAGFILREYGSYDTDNLGIFIASQVLLFIAPPVYNGANYFVFGRYGCPFWLTRFVTDDCVRCRRSHTTLDTNLSQFKFILTFTRALYYLPYLSPIHPGRVWTTFVTLDTFADIIAGNGAVRAANAGATEAERRAGLNLVKVSLFLLLGMFLAFMCKSAVS